MCEDCGCSITVTDDKSQKHREGHKHLHDNPQLNDTKTINIISKILEKNDHEANHNRKHLNKNNVLGINLMSSPGSGKTAFLESLKEVSDLKFSVIEGDLETDKDTERLNKKGIDAYQIQTGSACHLDAFMVHKALHQIDLKNQDICFIENVGNLVCPAAYDVGSHLNIVLTSIPEGEDKLSKYPVMFRKADLILFTKTDLLPYFDYDIEAEKKVARKLKPNVDILEISIKDKQSIKKVSSWIKYKKRLR